MAPSLTCKIAAKS